MTPPNHIQAALANPPARVSERAVNEFIDKVALGPFPGAELQAAGFFIDAFVSGNNPYSQNELLHLIRLAIRNGAGMIHFEENVFFGTLLDESGAFDLDLWSAIYTTVRQEEDPANPVVLGLTEFRAEDLELALNAILSGPQRHQLPDFGGFEWYQGTGGAWRGGVTPSGPWPTFDSFRGAMADLGMKTAMWIGDFGGDTYPSKLLESYYGADYTFILWNPEFPWDTPDPAHPEEPPIKTEIDRITDSKTIVRRGNAKEVAVLDNDGNIVLGGAKLSGAYQKQIRKFGVSDELGNVTMLIDADGDLWTGGGVSILQSQATLDSAAALNDALEITTPAGEPLVVITKSGAVFARGRLLEHADPLTLP